MSQFLLYLYFYSCWFIFLYLSFPHLPPGLGNCLHCSTVSHAFHWLPTITEMMLVQITNALGLTFHMFFWHTTAFWIAFLWLTANFSQMATNVIEFWEWNCHCMSRYTLLPKKTIAGEVILFEKIETPLVITGTTNHTLGSIQSITNSIRTLGPVVMLWMLLVDRGVGAESTSSYYRQWHENRFIQNLWLLEECRCTYLQGHISSTSTGIRMTQHACSIALTLMSLPPHHTLTVQICTVLHPVHQVTGL